MAINICSEGDLRLKERFSLRSLLKCLIQSPISLKIFVFSILVFWLTVIEMLVGERDIELWGSHFNDNGCDTARTSQLKGCSWWLFCSLLDFLSACRVTNTVHYILLCYFIFYNRTRDTIRVFFLSRYKHIAVVFVILFFFPRYIW